MSMVEAKRWLDDWDRDARKKLGLTFSEVRQILLAEVIELEKMEQCPGVKFHWNNEE